MAVVVLIALAVLVAWSLRTGTVDGSVEPPGSLLHSQVRQEARTGYVIAEPYQDGRLDVESGVYDEDGALRGSYWTHHDFRQTCSVDLVLAVQEGRDQASPTATPRPTHTPLPTDPPWNPEEYAVVEWTIDTDQGAGIAVALLPTPRAGWPASTPRPTYTPYPTATPSPLVSSVSLARLGRPPSSSLPTAWPYWSCPGMPPYPPTSASGPARIQPARPSCPGCLCRMRRGRKAPRTFGSRRPAAAYCWPATTSTPTTARPGSASRRGRCPTATG